MGCGCIEGRNNVQNARQNNGSTMNNVPKLLGGTDNQVRAYVNSRRTVEELREILEHESRHEKREWVLRQARSRMREIRKYSL